MHVDTIVGFPIGRISQFLEPMLQRFDLNFKKTNKTKAEKKQEDC